MELSPESSTQSYYRIGWKSHRPVVFASFAEYFETQSFTDVILVCEDGGRIRGHKVVLAACSSWFENHFLQTHDHTVGGATAVLVEGVKFSELLNILGYIYKGEVFIAGKDLAGFLKAAKKFNLKGLADFGKQKQPNLDQSSSSEGSGTGGSGSTTPEKSYKKYSNEAMSSAIQAVRDGMPVLTAARAFSVPTRTLYDKVKKAGIQTPGCSLRPPVRQVKASSTSVSAIIGSQASGTRTKTPISPSANRVTGLKEEEKMDSETEPEEQQVAPSQDARNDYSDDDIMSTAEFPKTK